MRGDHCESRRQNARAEGGSRGIQLPPWAVPIVNACEVCFPYFLYAAGLLLLLMLACIFIDKIQFPWLLNILSIFTFCVVVGFIAAVVARYDSLVFGWFGVVLGVAALIGGPLLISVIANAGGVHADSNGTMSPFVSNLLVSIPNIGVFLIAISLLNLVLGYAIQFILLGGEKGAQQIKFANEPRKKGAYKPGAFPKCWEMSRCRPGVRETCPNFIDKKTCWKRRSGCFCDRDLANYLVGAVDRSRGAGDHRYAGHHRQSTKSL